MGISGCLLTVALSIIAVVVFALQGEWTLIGPVVIVIVVTWAVIEIIAQLIRRLRT